MQLCKLFKCYSNRFLISLSILDLEILTKRVSVLYAVVHVPGNIIFLHLFRSENSFSVSVRRGRRPRFEETEKPFELRKRCMNYILICFSSSKERGGRDGGRERERIRILCPPRGGERMSPKNHSVSATCASSAGNFHFCHLRRRRGGGVKASIFLGRCGTVWRNV